MTRHTLRVLEFETVRSEIRDYCLTSEGSETIRRERVQTHSEGVDSLLVPAQALRACLQSSAEFPTVSFPAIGEILGSLEKPGSVLEASELSALSAYSRSSHALRRYLEIASREVGTPHLEALANAVPEMRPIFEKLQKFIDDEGAIREREIPALKSIRSQINRARQDLQREAQGLLSRDDLKRYWNATVPTQREGRTVLALKSDHRGKVKGIVHEVSATGATTFLEPEALVARNNAVTEAESRYHAELIRILRELTVFCREHREMLTDGLAAVTAIDRVYARARYAIAHDCLAADRTGATVRLQDARHPLLGSSAVPISVEFPPGKRLLVVTGPNTGGKTVSLKTVGLLAMMNQFGLEIPAGPGTTLPVFSGIHADIGDEQSIEQNLSTFSGHMRNIGRILAASDENSLVLLDELGSGTDPEEGGALAMAILDELLKRGPHSVITTHHGALKHYGFTQPSASNASMEFDLKSLRPTYRIVPGVPGSSHAIDVAAHMGLLRSVTKAARNYLQGQEYDTGRLIRTLTDREQELHREREALQADLQEVERRAVDIEKMREEIDRRERELKSGQIRELENWSAGVRSELENLVREIREGELTREKTLKAKEFMSRTSAELEQQRSAVESATRQRKPAPPSESSAEPGELEPGLTVRLKSAGKTGLLLRKSKGSRWQVQVGNLRLDAEESDLQVVDAAADQRPAISVTGVSARASLELDLRGRRLDEALDELDRQIDQAVLSGMNRFGVIHGTGEGVLQKGVQDYLKRNSNVRTFTYARPEDGGFGKTVVELK